jgi:hypothetical protein
MSLIANHARFFGSIIAVIMLLPGFESAAAGQTCGENTVHANLPNPPSGFLGYFFWSFESGVLAAFPPSTSASRLSSWMDREGFGSLSLSTYDTGIVDNEDEIQRSKERIDAGKKINNRYKQIVSWCGISYFSIAWNSDECGNLTEVFADRKLCAFELP